jgi:hypothetical protein
MIGAVAFKHHDHERFIIHVDTDKLNKCDYVDQEFLKRAKAKEDWCFIDASNWEDNPVKFPDDDIGISHQAQIKWFKTKPNPPIDHVMLMDINFDC